MVGGGVERFCKLTFEPDCRLGLIRCLIWMPGHVGQYFVERRASRLLELVESCECPFERDSVVGGARLPRGVPPKTKRRRLTLPEVPPPEFSPQRRLLILDTSRRSGLPAADFAVLVGVSKHALYA